MQLTNYITTLWYLLASDFKIYKRTIGDKIINFTIWLVTIVGTTVYLLPAFGLKASYSSFFAASLVGTAGLFEVFPSVSRLIHDFEGNNIIANYLILPIPSWLVFIRSILFYAANAASLSIWVIPLTKLLLWQRFDLSHISIGKFLLIFCLGNLFYGSFVIWIASRVMGIEKIGTVYMRFVFPMWFLGGFQFSWLVLYNFSPAFAYLDLLNPMMYIMEGMRAAVLGQEGSLNFWLCAFMLTFFIALFGAHGILRLKKRLDFI
jgi:ABC-2 type transport system permease protein